MLNLVQTNQTIAWYYKRSTKLNHFTGTVKWCGLHESRENIHTHKKKSKNGIYVFSALFDEPTSEIVINLNTLIRSNRHTEEEK